MGQIFGIESDDEESDTRNVRFYRGEIKSKPWPGKNIDKMLSWYGNYDKLEDNHQYIQWLFPIPERSRSNSSAQRLYVHEAQAIKVDEELQGKVVQAYRMMLDFYGLRLVNPIDGAVSRNRENWEERFHHLNRSQHNYLRITRIITSLGELGFERYQSPLVMKLMEEGVVHRTLPNTVRSAMRYWIDAIKDQNERTELKRRYETLTRHTVPPGNQSNGISKDSDVKLDECVEATEIS
ncbi:opioid growth factor receptor-like protein 1 [Mya arenaria]|uniref:opioid growth factor receptor-like protein 1 n=1 Tax=Mya arenaria TaxID=6604 RepID=UPI0022E27B25|nr:opioid growth factor receptor-like protein 1 [Mya arenaria]